MEAKGSESMFFVGVEGLAWREPPLVRLFNTLAAGAGWVVYSFNFFSYHERKGVSLLLKYRPIKPGITSAEVLLMEK